MVVNAAIRTIMTPSPDQSLNARAGETLPPAVADLLDGLQIYTGLSTEDLREMGKFRELPNISGLPVHPLRHPLAIETELRESTRPVAELPRDFLKALRAQLGREPVLKVEGLAAGASANPTRVTAFFPQREAHLGYGLVSILSRAPLEGQEPVGEQVVWLQCPEDEEQLLLTVPAGNLLILLGTDDLRPGLLATLELTHRRWGSAATPDEPAASGRPRLLAGGSFPFNDAGGGPALVFSGASTPDRWERHLAERVPALRDVEPAALALAGAEPWVAEPGGWLSPFWANPPLPAGGLGASAAWRERALAPEAVPFGVEIGPDGGIDLGREGDEAGFVVVPRQAAPPPLATAADRIQPRHVLTHRHAREEAMALWAIGFPPPEMV